MYELVGVPWYKFEIVLLYRSSVWRDQDTEVCNNLCHQDNGEQEHQALALVALAVHAAPQDSSPGSMGTKPRARQTAAAHPSTSISARRRRDGSILPWHPRRWLAD